MIGFLTLYALRLPVSYQHGRYIIPAMPVYFIWGFAGYISLMKAFVGQTAGRVILRAWGISIGIILFSSIFWRCSLSERRYSDSKRDGGYRYLAEQ